MALGHSNVSLQSEGHGQLLDIIDQLRSYGINRYVPLCGDQSSGKSSVLEAVSGVRFPMKDNLCTRFATELVLRRGREESASVSIVPGPQRNEEEKERLLGFQAPSAHVDNFPALVESAKEYLGLDLDTKAFSDDVLRVEVSGPDQPHLTLVDLPGVIHAENKQQSEEDVELVMSLVSKYMESPRSIILAVVSAKNDYANQIVTKLARRFDPTRTRTLGIITKPDTLDAGSESENKYVELATNKDVEFRLGWHVLRNRDYDSRSCSTDERDAKERNFFSQGAWKALPSNIKGVATLKPRLSGILKDHIMSELPDLTQSIQSEIGECENKMRQLGSERVTLEQQRHYLFKISQIYTSLVISAVNGTYTARDFFGDALTGTGFQNRLRAFVVHLSQNFADDLRTNGEYEHVVDDAEGESNEDLPYRRIRLSNYLNKVRELMRRTRGLELLGTFNPSIIEELFRRQSEPWDVKVEGFVDDILEAVVSFMKAALDYTMDEMISANIFRHFVQPCLKAWTSDLKTKSQEILRVRRQGHAITYNHYFVETIQKARTEVIVQQLQLRGNEFGTDRYGNEFPATPEKVMKLIRGRVEANMDMFACEEAFEQMKAYYKVTMKTLIDNIATLGVEQCIMQKLPEAFTPEKVAELDEDLIRSMATESEASYFERKNVTEKLRRLEKGLLALNQLPQRRGPQDLTPLFDYLAQPKMGTDPEARNTGLLTPSTTDSLQSLDGA